MASYYFWKWAQNDLPGRPAEVQAALLRGQLPPALQPFDARRLLTALDRLRARRPEEEWRWEVVPGRTRTLARCVFVTAVGPERSKAASDRFWRATAPLGLSGYDEGTGGVINGLPPKLNRFSRGENRGADLYDVGVDELPTLLRAIDPGARDPFVVLGNRSGHFVQCYAEGRRFLVEWACNRYLPRTVWDQWRAQDPARLAALGGVYGGEKTDAAKNPDLLRYADTLCIFQAFARHEPRPTRYPWRNINHLLG